MGHMWEQMLACRLAMM
jgi:hypothetical protein